MATLSTDNSYENTGNNYTELNEIVNHVYSTLKPTSNHIPEAQTTAKARYCCAPYKLATVCLGLLCALLITSTLYVNFKASEQCPQAFVLFNSHCYYFSLEKKSWNDSRTDCKERGADLVVIETKEKQVFMYKHCRQDGFWIGLTDSSIEGTWLWVDESQLDVGYWDDGEPNSYKGKNEDCVHAFKKQHALNNWNDAVCNTSWYWVCEKPE